MAVEGGYRGAALNLAARLCSQAVAGQVLVSRPVADELPGFEEATFDPRGTAELKGFDRPVEMLEPVPRDARAGVSRAARGQSRPAPDRAR